MGPVEAMGGRPHSFIGKVEHGRTEGGEEVIITNSHSLLLDTIGRALRISSHLTHHCPHHPRAGNGHAVTEYWDPQRNNVTM